MAYMASIYSLHGRDHQQETLPLFLGGSPLTPKLWKLPNWCFLALLVWLIMMPSYPKRGMGVFWGDLLVRLCLNTAIYPNACAPSMCLTWIGPSYLRVVNFAGTPDWPQKKMLRSNPITPLGMVPPRIKQAYQPGLKLPAMFVVLAGARLTGALEEKTVYGP